jgi:iron complex transport system ATP-binding protein
MDSVLMGRAPYIPLHGSPDKKDREIARTALDKVGLGHLKDRPYTKISGGERQLVLVARALAQKSPIILMDEPTAHLDFKNQYQVLEMVVEAAQSADLTILMTLHDPNLASFFADYILTLSDQKISDSGSPATLLDELKLEALYRTQVGVVKINNRTIIYSKKYFN